jgi:hypothetical protein
MKLRFVIALMASNLTHNNCGDDVLCWKPIRHAPEYDTLRQCQTDADLLAAIYVKQYKCIPKR